MANTTEDKLRLLISTKRGIKNSMTLVGVDIPEDAPFSTYKDYITSIGITETTTTRDLMMLADYYKDVIHGPFVHDNYTELDETNIINLSNLILEGEV